MVNLLIQNGKKLYNPIVEEGIQLDWEQQGVPGKLSFTVVKDALINFQEGNVVTLSVNGVDLFKGYVFSKKRGKEGTIQVTAYDQLRYLKNKDTLEYNNKTASEVILLIAKYYGLITGEITDTGYKIPGRIESNKTLMDIIGTALAETNRITKTTYIMYDDFGAITLKNYDEMKLDLLIDQEAGENFDYTSSIDNNTYNRIKLFYNDNSGKKPVVLESKDNMARWGILQYTENIDEKVNSQEMAEGFLALYNQKTRNLTVKNVFGDIRVRAGCSVLVSLDLGDVIVGNYMIVQKVKHTFHKDNHTMDLTLRGGVISG